METDDGSRDHQESEEPRRFVLFSEYFDAIFRSRKDVHRFRDKRNDVVRVCPDVGFYS